MRQFGQPWRNRVFWLRFMACGFWWSGPVGRVWPLSLLDGGFYSHSAWSHSSVEQPRWRLRCKLSDYFLLRPLYDNRANMLPVVDISNWQNKMACAPHEKAINDVQWNSVKRSCSCRTHRMLLLQRSQAVFTWLFCIGEAWRIEENRTLNDIFDSLPWN
jgi:hypothetical protein